MFDHSNYIYNLLQIIIEVQSLVQISNTVYQGLSYDFEVARHFLKEYLSKMG